ncbi:Major facilitator superfamily domain-containing protein 8 [Aphelenchoides fujianensis]|nr:Major facilitator superfamily domain-containing protein 8 [Aphelenchoides fujianensis]
MGAKIVDAEKSKADGRQTDWKSIYVLTLVAFLGALKIGLMSGTLWAYITELDRSITATFYGYLLSMTSIGNICSALAAGLFSNWISSTTPALVAGKFASIVGCVLFLLVELYERQRKAILISMKLAFGISIGLMSVVKAQIASSSTEEDRPRAVSMVTMSLTLGIATGPLLTSALTLIKYPGFEFIFGLHLNFYTVPGYFMILTGVIALVLLCTCFNGQMRKTPVDLPEELKEVVEVNEKGKLAIPYDVVAVVICILTRIVFGLKLVYIQSVSGPYMMSTFRMTSSDYVIFSSAMHVVGGLIGVAFNLSYIFGCMQKWLSPRFGITLAIVIQLVFYFTTYPYSFLPNRMQYEVLGVDAANNTVVLEGGCRAAYTWCADTTAINFYVYVAAQLLVGLAIPLCMLNMEILYSTVLGPIKQGTMQGVFIICGEVLQVFGPIVMTSLYESSGPAHIWQIMMVANLLLLGVWIVFYRRMIPYSAMVRARLGDKPSGLVGNDSKQQLVVVPLGSSLKDEIEKRID